MEKNEEQKKPLKSGFTREIVGLSLIFWAIFLVLCLVTFDKNDPTLNHVKTDASIHNYAGLFGAYVSGFLNEGFGLCSFLWPLFFGAFGVVSLLKRSVTDLRKWSGFVLLVLFLLEIFDCLAIHVGDFSPSGIIGHSLYVSTKRYLNPVGAQFLWFFLFMISLQLIFSFSWVEIIAKISKKIQAFYKEQKEHKNKLNTLFRENIKTKIFKTIGEAFLFLWQRIRSKNEAETIPSAAKRTKSIAKDNTRKTKQKQEIPQEETLFKPTENLFKDVTDDDDILGLQKKKTKKIPEPETKANEDSKVKVSEKQILFGNADNEETIQDEKEEKQKEREKIQDEIQDETQKGEDLEQKDTQPEEKSKVKVGLSSFSPFKKLKNFIAKGNEDGEEEEEIESEEDMTQYPLPDTDLLEEAAEFCGEDQEDLRDKGEVLIQTLQEFNIEGELTAITTGPVVTLFEVRPASGVRVNKFMSLSDDIARVLKTPSVRIISPVPGKDTVGIEIPNKNRETVNFRELIETDAFRSAESPLFMVLGKDTAGRPVYADLTKMPHMLIAGATGAGKSVCLNTILASFLYRAQPSELKLLLVDPKRVEMSVYADEPHLIHPVVNDPADAKNALDWALNEMEKRLEIMSSLGVRNIVGYNKRLASFGDAKPDQFKDLEFMPYIAIVIDELSDLMMSSDVRKDIEACIIRLAQLARASGIHMIVATQRPSVDIVTGLIKANFPSRIAFRVSSSSDSRTILDTVGAEKLLGRGDMLYRLGDSSLQRLHGPFLSDNEVCDIVAYWKSLAKPSYKLDFSKAQQNKQTSANASAEEDDLFEDVLEFVKKEGKASISRIQREFRIGYNRSARLVEALDAKGYLYPADGGGSKPRNVRQ